MLPFKKWTKDMISSYLTASLFSNILWYYFSGVLWNLIFLLLFLSFFSLPWALFNDHILGGMGYRLSTIIILQMLKYPALKQDLNFVLSRLYIGQLDEIWSRKFNRSKKRLLFTTSLSSFCETRMIPFVVF